MPMGEADRTVVRRRDAGQGWAPLPWLLMPVGGLVVLGVLWSQPSSRSSVPVEATA